MSFSSNFILFLLIPTVIGKCNVLVENVTIEYVGKTYVDTSYKMEKVNRTNALNAMFLAKVDIPENTKIVVKGFRWVHDDYRVQIVQFDKNIKDLLEMELFDLQSLFVRNARPPIVWPIQKGVAYHTKWIPDGNKFPPALPTGKYKVQITKTFPNKIKTAVVNFFGILL